MRNKKRESMKGYPHWFLRSVLLALVILIISGALMVPTTLIMRAEFDLDWRLPNVARLWTSAVHAGFGFVMMLLVGAIWSIHMRSGWRRHKHRSSGVSLAVVFLMLALTAVAIYYLGESVIANWAAYLHLVAGVLVMALFGWHWWCGRRSRMH